MTTLAFWTMAIGLAAGLAWVLHSPAAAELRDRRRRRRNYGRVVSRVNRPMVMLSVRAR